MCRWLLPLLCLCATAHAQSSLAGIGDDAARNVWNAQLVSSRVIAEQMQQALANAPVAEAERALYVRVWSCLIDAAVSPVLIDFETATQLCTIWASSPIAGTARGVDRTPYTAGNQSAQVVWTMLQTVGATVSKRWPDASSDQVMATAVCATDAANAFGAKQGVATRRLTECALRAGIKEAPTRKAKRQP